MGELPPQVEDMAGTILKGMVDYPHGGSVLLERTMWRWWATKLPEVVLVRYRLGTETLTAIYNYGALSKELLRRQMLEMS